MIVAILNSDFRGVVHGYEMNRIAAAKAAKVIAQFGLAGHYVVHAECFFEKSGRLDVEYAIANPPYLPCRDRDSLLLPGLWGGPEGNTVSKGLLTHAHDKGCPNVLLEVASYSNPTAVVEHAGRLGFKLVDLQISKMTARRSCRSGSKR